jgi:hypothetical protein
MSVKDILNKLAEKQMLEGNQDLAFRLVEAADKSEKCHFCDKRAQMMKRKGKKDIHVCKDCGKSTKCALKGCSAKMLYGEMVKRGGKAYCCSDCASKDSKMKKTALDEMLEKYAKKELTLQRAKEELSPLGISIKKHEGEYCVNFKGGKEETAYYTDDLGDAVGTGKQMAKKRGKKAYTSPDMLGKYAGIEDLKKWREEHGKGKKSKSDKETSDTSDKKSSLKSKIQEMDGFVKMVGKGYAFETKKDANKALPVAEQGSGRFLNWKVTQKDDMFVLDVHGTDAKKSTKEAFINAGDLLKKYALGEDFGELEGDDTEDSSPMPEDHSDLDDVMPEDHSDLDDLHNVMAEGYDAGMKEENNCPYSTNTDEWFAWQAGWKAAVGGQNLDSPDAKYYSYGENDQDDMSKYDQNNVMSRYDKDGELLRQIEARLKKYTKD